MSPGLLYFVRVVSSWEKKIENIYEDVTWWFILSNMLNASFTYACHLLIAMRISIQICHVMSTETQNIRTPTWLSKPQREKTYLLKCASNEDSNQPVHPQSHQSLRCPHEETLHPWLSKNRQWRFWSDCAYAQSDQNHRWAHMSKGTFSVVAAQFFQNFLPYMIPGLQRVEPFKTGRSHQVLILMHEKLIRVDFNEINAISKRCAYI